MLLEVLTDLLITAPAWLQLMVSEPSMEYCGGGATLRKVVELELSQVDIAERVRNTLERSARK